MQVIVIRKSNQERKDTIEQRLVSIADLSILVERLREQLKDNTDKKRDRAILCELNHAKQALKQAIGRAARIV